MSFTLLYALLTLLALAVVFAVTYRLKGWKVALLATAIAFVLAAIGLLVLVTLILSMM